MRTIEKFYRESSVLTPAIYHLWITIICGFPCLYIFQRKMFRWRGWSHVQGHELNLSLYYCLLYSQPFNRFLSLCSNACSLGTFQMSAGIKHKIKLDPFSGGKATLVLDRAWLCLVVLDRAWLCLVVLCTHVFCLQNKTTKLSKAWR